MSNKKYLQQFFTMLESRKAEYEEMLKTESQLASGFGEGVQSSMDWLKVKMRAIGASVEAVEADSSILRASLGKSRKKKTLLVYGHLVLADTSVGEEGGGKIELFGREATDARGPLLCLEAAINVFRNLKIDVPVNVRFLFDCLLDEESAALREYLVNEQMKIFDNVDFVCMFDNRFKESKKSVLTCGMRGYSKFEVTVEGSSAPLHSGIHGGAVYEAMTDIMALLSSLINTKGDILISGLSAEVRPVTPEEDKEFTKSSFDVEKFKSETGTKRLLYKEDKNRVHMHLVRYPSVSIHGVESYPATSTGNTIPGRAAARFTVWTVPDQTESFVLDAVTDHLSRTMASLKSPNKLTVKLVSSEQPWLADSKDRNFLAGLKSLNAAKDTEVETIREGCCIPRLPAVREASGRELLLLPVGRCAPGGGGTYLDPFLEGTKTIIAYLNELAN